MAMLGGFSLLLVQLWACEAHSHKGSQGLSCVNDFVNTVSCTWNRTRRQPAPGVDCWIFGVKKTWVLRDMTRHPEPMIRSCKLSRQRRSPPGCSLVFEDKQFNTIEVMPNISMECNGTLVENLTNYKPVDHIKMHPPGLPSINKTANYTWIWWSAGSPLTVYTRAFNFQLQVTQENQTWKDGLLFSTEQQVMKVPSSRVKGSCRVRVRVRYEPGSHWSDWSPTASWMGGSGDVVPREHDWLWVRRGLMLSVALVVATLVLLYGTCVITGCFRLKRNPVPTPSKYFHTLHSVHKGNLKKWLNPPSAPESFFTTETPEHISPVEVCESWDVVPSASPCSSSSSVLLHFQGYPSADSVTSGIVDNFSSSSSSYFYNMGYFTSASSEPGPAYFSYQEDFHRLKNGHVSLCPSFAAPPAYETLKRQPQSPDSGLGIGQEDEGEVPGDPRRSPVFNPPLHHPGPAPLPQPPGLNHTSSDGQQVDVPAAAARPVAGAMCRSSSMPVESCKTGYLTLKELQTTFSNKSI